MGHEEEGHLVRGPRVLVAGATCIRIAHRRGGENIPQVQNAPGHSSTEELIGVASDKAYWNITVNQSIGSQTKANNSL